MYFYCNVVVISALLAVIDHNRSIYTYEHHPREERNTSVKVIAFGFTGIMLGTAAAFAVEPATESLINGTKIYTNERGMTLYTFDGDALSASACYDQCSKVWQPFAPAAGAIPDPHDDWTIIGRTDGAKIWAHHGKPLYTFAEDVKPGDTLGEGKDNAWHVATPD